MKKKRILGAEIQRLALAKKFQGVQFQPLVLQLDWPQTRPMHMHTVSLMTLEARARQPGWVGYCFGWEVGRMQGRKVKLAARDGRMRWEWWQ